MPNSLPRCCRRIDEAFAFKPLRGLDVARVVRARDRKGSSTSMGWKSKTGGHRSADPDRGDFAPGRQNRKAAFRDMNPCDRTADHRQRPSTPRRREQPASALYGRGSNGSARRSSGPIPNRIDAPPRSRKNGVDERPVAGPAVRGKKKTIGSGLGDAILADAFGTDDAPHVSCKPRSGRALPAATAMFRSSLDFARHRSSRSIGSSPRSRYRASNWLKPTGASNSAQSNAVASNIVPSNGPRFIRAARSTRQTSRKPPRRLGPVKLDAKGAPRSGSSFRILRIPCPRCIRPPTRSNNGIGAAAPQDHRRDCAARRSQTFLNLSAYVHLMSRGKRGAMQRAYEDHLRAAEAGHPEIDGPGRAELSAWAGRDASTSRRRSIGYERGGGGGKRIGSDQCWPRLCPTAGRDQSISARPHNITCRLQRPAITGECTIYGRDARQRTWRRSRCRSGTPLDRESPANTGLSAAQHTLAKLARTGIGGPRRLSMHS